MVDSHKLVKVGRILKTFGIAGQLRCQLNDQFSHLLKKGKFVWLEIDGLLTPFLVTKFLLQHKSLICFADVNDERKAALLSGSWIFLNRADYKDSIWPKVESKGPEYKFLESYRVNILEHNLSGLIEHVMEYPSQEMAFITLEIDPDKELLVPLVDEFIVNIDPSVKLITLRLPDGLLDL